MRERVQGALELAGFTIATNLERYQLPAPNSNGASVKGHLQSSDQSGALSAYYLRPKGSGVGIPKFLTSIIRAAQGLQPPVAIFVVAESDANGMREDAQKCGAGLLQLSTDGTLDVLVEPGGATPGLTAGEFDALVQSVRGAVVSAGSLEDSVTQARYHEVTVLGRDMNGQIQRKLVALRRRKAATTAWVDETISELEAAADARDVAAVRRIETRASRGPSLGQLP